MPIFWIVAAIFAGGIAVAVASSGPSNKGAMGRSKVSIAKKPPGWIGVKPGKESVKALRGAPYRPQDAYAVAHKLLSWVVFPDPAWVPILRTQLTGLFNNPTLSPREKTRGIIVGIIVPILANEFEYTGPNAINIGDKDFGVWTRQGWLGTWLNQVVDGGTDEQKQALSAVTYWMMAYFVGPETAAVPVGWNMISTWRGGLEKRWPEVFKDSGWNTAPTIHQTRAILLELNQKLQGYMINFCDAVGDASWVPQPCELRTAMLNPIKAVLLNDQLHNSSDDVIIAGSVKIIEISSNVPLITNLRNLGRPPDAFGQVVAVVATVIAAIIAVVAPYVGIPAVIATSIAASTAFAISIATAIKDGNSKAAMQAIVNSGVAQGLVDAGVFNPKDFAEALHVIDRINEGAGEIKGNAKKLADELKGLTA